METSEYEPYGRLLNRGNDNRAGYTGHVMDAASGLTYMQQRYYDPGIGAFLSVDPVTAYSNPVGAFNRYWYASGNPYRFVDPDGRKAKAKTEDDKPRNEHEGSRQDPEDPNVYNCHSEAWHDRQGDPTDSGNRQGGTDGKVDQSPYDDMLEAQQLDTNEPNQVNDVLVYGHDANGNGRLEENEIDHSARVIAVDEEGNTTRVLSKEGPTGPLVDHHPFDQNPAYGQLIEWFRRK
ncbi:RHS repeat-associated core domain-containing protein [Thermomonas sp.]|uniref:RHS repeat-associated core domain-containing protein n=1 Tax=Thermomonas sp. TaxID=1971895 RepID=UPI002633BE2F|nr:RHS repeat-associated core domain-containing protein [Thermomonas sp.]